MLDRDGQNAPPATRPPLRSRCAQGGRRSAPPEPNKLPHELLGLIAPTAADLSSQHAQALGSASAELWIACGLASSGNGNCSTIPKICSVGRQAIAGQGGHQRRVAAHGDPVRRGAVHNEVQAAALWCWQAIVEEPLGLLARPLRVPLGPMPAQTQSLAAPAGLYEGRTWGGRQRIDNSAAAMLAIPTTACSRDGEREAQTAPQSEMHEVRRKGGRGIRGYGGKPRAGMRA